MILQVGVKVLIRNSNGEYLFVRREPSFKTGPQKWDIPGGRIEPDEPLIEGLRREVKEETALELTSISKLLAAQDIFVKEKELHVIRLTYVGEANGSVVLSDEHDDYRWMTYGDVLSEKHVDSYLREALGDREL